MRGQNTVDRSLVGNRILRFYDLLRFYDRKGKASINEMEFFAFVSVVVYF